MLVREDLILGGSYASVTSTAMAGVAMANDHLSITWCRELMVALAEALLSVGPEQLTAERLRSSVQLPATPVLAKERASIGWWQPTVLTKTISFDLQVRLALCPLSSLINS
jgi:hypothetical protein